MEYINNQFLNSIKNRRNMKIIFLTILSVLPLYLVGQCISGDCYNSYGVFKFANGNTFKGYFINGTRTNGTTYYPTGDKYSGNYVNNERHGQGIYYYKNGDRFEGTYDNGKKDKGTFIFKNGDKYIGEFTDDKLTGEGTFYYQNGKTETGFWENGKPAFEATQRGFMNTYVVLVGVSNYQNPRNNLNFSDDDAMHLSNFFVQTAKLPAQNVYVLLNENATKQNILSATRQVFAKATRNDFIIFYFSGHGAPGYFVPYDCNNSQLMHDEIKAIFKASPAKFKMCVADACYSGSIRTKAGSTEKTFEVSETTEKTVPNDDLKGFRTPDVSVIVMMSSRSSQTSQEMRQLKQGVFTYFFIQGLRGEANTNNDAVVTISELYNYLKSETMRLTNSKQIPTIHGRFDVNMPLLQVR